MHDSLALLAKALQKLCGLSFRVSDVDVHCFEGRDKTPVVMRLEAYILTGHALRNNEHKHRKHGTKVHKAFATPLRVKPDYHASH